MANFRCVVFLLFLLTFFNLFFLLNYLISSPQASTESKSCSEEQVAKHARNTIDLSLNIMDIYRLDVSCDYITRDLGDKIKNVYVNYKKKCSFSSLNLGINSKIAESASKPELTAYKPYLNNDLKYDPFNETNQDVEHVFKSLQPGGVWHPKLEPNKPCGVEDLDNVVFIVPFSRSRIENLKLFLINMHSYLQTYNHVFKYRILVVEQLDMGSRFNKGRLLNTAAKYIIDNLGNEIIDCIVIHDVDMIPSSDGDKLKDHGDYRCRKMPWHLSQKVYNLNNKQERVYNQFLTGGVLSLRLDHFIAVNGFSNEYFGWGAEDDDFQIRMFSSSLCIMRPGVSNGEAPFLMLPHASSSANTNRFNVLSTALVRKNQDGLSNIIRLSKIVYVKMFKSFTYLGVQVLN